MHSYDDVHTHLTHRAFSDDLDAVVERAFLAGVRRIVTNGTEPASNRVVLQLAARFDSVYPALGIYPIDAAAGAIDRASWPHEGYAPPTVFDVDAEIAFIDAHGAEILAVGECGLDRYWIQDDAVDREQERVLEALCEVAIRHDIPVILHSRKAEQRVFELVRSAGVRRADFHCFAGKLALAKQVAEAGYTLSIPAVVERGESFQRIAAGVPLEALLTETDAPYLSADRDVRSEPAQAARSARAIARARGVSEDVVAEALAMNFARLFGGAVERVDAWRRRQRAE
jgi:TatD DNase family protein